VVPGWSAIVSPFSATGDEWEVSGRPDGLRGSSDTSVWWPHEHFDRPVPLLQLRHQMGLFRRESDVLLAMATDIPRVAGMARGDTLRGTLILSTGPGDIRRHPASAVAGSPAATRVAIPSTSQIASLELDAGASRVFVARDRFGIVSPGTLAEMETGDVDVSQPVLIEPLAPGDPLPADPDSALARMIGLPELHDPRRIGVYWETYGLNPSDTVDIAVRFERLVPPPGLIRRIGLALGIGTREDMSVSVGWREPQRGQVIATTPGRIPIQSRSLTVDVSQIPAGDYSLTVSIRRPDGRSIARTRSLRLVR
jgi:hypothetical protein